jgi:hypothetical protein
MNEFTPTSLPVGPEDKMGYGDYRCPYSRCRWEHPQNVLRIGQPRCKQCGVVLEWVEEQS